MDQFIYVITPCLAWLFAGSSKFIINSLKARQLAFSAIGYGGLPSNHSAIVSSTAALIGFREGIGHPSFGVALTLALIVMVDANGLRKHIGQQAVAINMIRATGPRLRERMGHTRIEIFAGIFVGVSVALLTNCCVGASLVLP